MPTIRKKLLDADVACVLSRCQISCSSLQLPDGQLDRDLYTRVNKVLELLGGKWNRGQRAHVFPDGLEVAEMVKAVVEDGAVIDERKTWQFFETPHALAVEMVERADIDSSHSVLEPSAGLGAIAKVIRNRNPKRLQCYEMHHGRAMSLKSDGFAEVAECDFLTVAVDELFDRIVANPPFSGGQAARHFDAMWAHLAPGGRVVCVMDSGVTSRTTMPHSRARWIVEQHGEFIPLPEKTFKSSGTGVSAVLAIADKPA